MQNVWIAADWVNEQPGRIGYPGNPENDEKVGFGGCAGPSQARGEGTSDGVAKADVVGLHLDPCGETTKTRAAIVRQFRCQVLRPGPNCLSKDETNP